MGEVCKSEYYAVKEIHEVELRDTDSQTICEKDHRYIN